MQINKIVQLGNPILRKKASPIKEEYFGSSELNELAIMLINTMKDRNGIGLAAPQIGICKRAFAYGFDNTKYPNRPNIPFQALFNPSFEPIGNIFIEDYEGCLSVGDLRGKVLRYKSIYFKGYDAEGKIIENEVSDLYARVFQHEYDHLDGVIFLDKISDLASLGFHQELLKNETLQST